MPIARAQDLDITYEASGPDCRMPVLLIHDWPDDASTWDVVASVLAHASFRVVVPTLGGFGGTRFHQRLHAAHGKQRDPGDGHD